MDSTTSQDRQISKDRSTGHSTKTHKQKHTKSHKTHIKHIRQDLQKCHNRIFKTKISIPLDNIKENNNNILIHPQIFRMKYMPNKQGALNQ
jgi:hypothetical protein